MKFSFLFQSILTLSPLFGLSSSDVEVLESKEKEFGPVHGWPKYNRFGQISAVDVDFAGNVYVFHRGNRQWGSSSFLMTNVFADRDKGPIPNETIVVLDSTTGSAITKTGANLFYLPHGLTVDDENNIWVTDVALHQVFKFPAIDLKKESGVLKNAILTLGVPFQPGNDKRHFCKPTAVAVDKETKEFYVADGYCNSRIVKFDSNGTQLLSIGRSSLGPPEHDAYMLNVPHALALGQEQTLYVADRENQRVLSYDFQTGKFKRRFAEELRSKLYSVAYSPLKGGLLFVLANTYMGLITAAIYSTETGKLILSFSPKSNFTNPHDLAVSHNGEYCFVVELNPFKIWKFKLDMNIISQLNQNKIANGKLPEEPVPAESKIENSGDFETRGSFLAAGLIISVVVISFLAFMLHYYTRKGGYRRNELRRLILDDDEGGIRLT